MARIDRYIAFGLLAFSVGYGYLAWCIRYFLRGTDALQTKYYADWTCRIWNLILILAVIAPERR